MIIIKVPLFVPRSGVRIAVTDAEAQIQGNPDVNRLDELQKELPSASAFPVNYYILSLFIYIASNK
jgi:hypothetical protein